MKEREKDFFQANIDAYKLDDARRFGWFNNRTQTTRFIQIAKLIKMGCSKAHVRPSDISIVDYGCGDAALFSFLHSMHIGVRYIGIEAMDQSVKDARKRIEDENLPAVIHKFAWDGHEVWPVAKPVDFVVESGAFCTTDLSTRELMIRKMLEFPGLGFAGAFLSSPGSLVFDAHPDVEIMMPEDVIKLVDISQFQYVLWGDYMFHDFALGAFKRSATS